MNSRIIPVAAFALLVAAPASAAGFKVFGGVSYVAPLGEDDVDIGAITDSIEASEVLGWTVGLESRFNKIVGLEIDYVNSTNDIEFGGSTIGEVQIQPLSATLNFHLVPTGIVNLYLGPTASYFIFGDADVDPLGSLDVDNEFAYGASLGLEIGLGGTVAVLGGIRWLKVDIRPDGSDEIPLDPLYSRLGLALRFGD